MSLPHYLPDYADTRVDETYGYGCEHATWNLRISNGTFCMINFICMYETMKIDTKVHAATRN